ncbi:MAG: hypothetical protein OXL40_00865 [Bacteroidota bacterium]|nr:hypothetical protein [Bacteroidota bacterium]
MNGNKTAELKKTDRGVELHIEPKTLLNNGTDKEVWEFRAAFTGMIDHYNIERYDLHLGWYKVNCRLQHHQGGEFLTCNDPKDLDRVVCEGYRKHFARVAGPCEADEQGEYAEGEGRFRRMQDKP